VKEILELGRIAFLKVTMLLRGYKPEFLTKNHFFFKTRRWQRTGRLSRIWKVLHRSHCKRTSTTSHLLTKVTKYCSCIIKLERFTDGNFRASVYCKMRNVNMYKEDLQKFCSSKLNWPKVRIRPFFWLIQTPNDTIYIPNNRSSFIFFQINPIKTGFLVKSAENKMTGKPQNRYFYLKNRFLFYYKSPQVRFSSLIFWFVSCFEIEWSGFFFFQDSQPISVICLEDCKVFHLNSTNFTITKTNQKLFNPLICWTDSSRWYEEEDVQNWASISKVWIYCCINWR
jgi:hypothetical protein